MLDLRFAAQPKDALGGMLRDSPKQRTRPLGACLWWSLGLMSIALAGFIVQRTLRPTPVWTSPAPFGASEAAQAVRKDVVEARMKLYLEGSADLKSNLKYQAIFLAAAIVLLANGARTLQRGDFQRDELNLLTSTIVVIEFMLPSAMLYLWIEFGYLYLDLIDNHKILWHIVQAGEEGASLQALLSDHFFALDFWFILFDPSYVGSMREYSWWLGLVKSIGYVTFFGLSHATMVVLVSESYSQRLLVGEDVSAGDTSVITVGPRMRMMLKTACMLYVLFIVLVLYGSHVEFCFGGGKPNYGQYMILGIASVMIYPMAKLFPLPRAQNRMTAKSDMGATEALNVGSQEVRDGKGSERE